MKTVDEQLAERIKAVFDDFPAAGADTGWEELRRKYPDKRSRRPVIFWMSAAASLVAIATATWLLMPDRLTINTNAVKITTRGSAKSADTASARVDPAPTTAELPAAGLVISGSSRIQSPVVSRAAKAGIVIPENRRSISNPDSAITATPATITTITLAGQPKPLVATSHPIKDSLLNVATLTAQITNQKGMLLPAHPGGRGTPGPLTDIDVNKPDRHVLFSIYGGSQFSYANGSTGHVNINAGIASAIPVTANLKISAGLGVTQNTLSFKNGIPRNTSEKLNDAYAGAYLQNTTGTGGIPQGAMSGNPVTFSSLENINASLLGLELPVNFTYSFPHTKREFFISGGISSFTYINEEYVSEYKVTAPFSANTAPTSSTEILNKKFETVDVAGMLNLSIGMGYPFGKYHQLFIEPFMKYPLQGLGYQHIRYGSGGVNLKLNLRKK